MANFFLDNEDIRFLFDFIDMEELARIASFQFSQCPTPHQEVLLCQARIFALHSTWEYSRELSRDNLEESL